MTGLYCRCGIPCGLFISRLPTKHRPTGGQQRSGTAVLCRQLFENDAMALGFKGILCRFQFIASENETQSFVLLANVVAVFEVVPLILTAL